jgi:hypothetical protein
VAAAAAAAMAAGVLAPVAAAPASPATGTAGAGTVWLCRPGTAGDPCAADLATTSVSATGSESVRHPTDATSSRFDCFYVYPTVSLEPTTNADLRIQAAETAVATSQAAPFSQVCRVWAPMYRQVTLAGLARGLGVAAGPTAVAYDSLQRAFEDYLAHDNRGRPIVFLGHSQGAAMLILLLQKLVVHDPALRHRLVMAVILGGNVTVPDGKLVGGSFADIPLCHAAGQVGCVVAYSSFLQPPPPTSLFGRPGQGVSLQSGQTRRRGVHVACVNPADLSGGTGALEPMFPSLGKVATPWVSYPGLYTARCRSSGGATWLQVSVAADTGGRPTVSQVDGPQWGLHVYDVNLALGNLVADVAAAESHWHR